MTGQDNQPKDYVESGNHHRNVNKVIDALSKPSSILLFVIVLVGIIVGGNWLRTKAESEVLSDWLRDIERNRSQEMHSCHETLKELVNACADRRLFEKQLRMRGGDG